jgi:general secretion pathway protein K
LRIQLTARSETPQSGFALLIVLLTLGFLALLGTQIVATARSDVQVSDNLKQQAILEAAADGAVEDVVFRMLALHDARFQPDGVVRELRVGRTLVLVRIEDEGDRVNLNTASGPLLRGMLMELGTPPAAADHIAAAILDWRMSGTTARPNGAKAAEYRAAGRGWGPPGTPFLSTEELLNVFGVTPALYDLMAPHLTVLTDGDPDLSTTRDPIVARALADSGSVADLSAGGVQATDQVLRIETMAIGPGPMRFALTVVARGNFGSPIPRSEILLRETGRQPAAGLQADIFKTHTITKMTDRR